MAELVILLSHFTEFIKTIYYGLGLGYYVLCLSIYLGRDQDTHFKVLIIIDKLFCKVTASYEIKKGLFFCLRDLKGI